MWEKANEMKIDENKLISRKSTKKNCEQSSVFFLFFDNLNFCEKIPHIAFNFTQKYEFFSLVDKDNKSRENPAWQKKTLSSNLWGFFCVPKNLLEIKIYYRWKKRRRNKKWLQNTSMLINFERVSPFFFVVFVVFCVLLIRKMKIFFQRVKLG